MQEQLSWFIWFKNSVYSSIWTISIWSNFQQTTSKMPMLMLLFGSVSRWNAISSITKLLIFVLSLAKTNKILVKALPLSLVNYRRSICLVLKIIIEHQFNFLLILQWSDHGFLCLSGAHHLDLRASTDEDPGWLLAQRESELQLIQGWLNDYHANKKATFSMWRAEVLWILVLSWTLAANFSALSYLYRNKSGQVALFISSVKSKVSSRKKNQKNWNNKTLLTALIS